MKILDLLLPIIAAPVFRRMQEVEELCFSVLVELKQLRDDLDEGDADDDAGGVVLDLSRYGMRRPGPLN